MPPILLHNCTLPFTPLLPPFSGVSSEKAKVWQHHRRRERLGNRGFPRWAARGSPASGPLQVTAVFQLKRASAVNANDRRPSETPIGAPFL